MKCSVLETKLKDPNCWKRVVKRIIIRYHTEPQGLEATRRLAELSESELENKFILNAGRAVWLAGCVISESG